MTLKNELPFLLLAISSIALAVMFFADRRDTNEALQMRLCELETMNTFLVIKPSASVTEYAAAIKKICWHGKELEEGRK